MSENMGECEELLKLIADKVVFTEDYITGFAEQTATKLGEMSTNLEKLAKNQQKIYDLLNAVDNRVYEHSKISIEQTKYLKDIQSSRGALSDDVLSQLANIEAVSKQLNIAILGGTNNA